jgi:small subunit ribosomal protein S12
VRQLKKNPQLKGVIRRVYTTNPKKPNSANRKVAKVQLSNKKFVITALKGLPHSLKKFSKVLICGGGFTDTPNVSTKAIPGKESFVIEKKIFKRRSVYGIKKQVLYVIYF